MSQPNVPRPPDAFRAFEAQFPKTAQAWNLLREGEGEGPLDPKTRRLLKLAVSIGARLEGSTRSAVRKAFAEGARRDEILQTVAVAASIVGLPSAVAAHTWIEDVLERLSPPGIEA